MQPLEAVKQKIKNLVTRDGCLYEADFVDACAHLDKDSLDHLGAWVASNEFSLHKGMSSQYVQDLKKRVKNPNVEDVKDTKQRTHKNKDKLQKSKKKQVEKSSRFAQANHQAIKATMNLNKIIDELAAYEDEFLPAWKKFQAALHEDTEFIEILSVLEIDSQQWNRIDDVQRAVIQLIDSYADQIPSNAYFPEIASELTSVEAADPNLPFAEKLRAAVMKAADVVALREVFKRIFYGVSSDEGFEIIDEGIEPRDPEQLRQPEVEYELEEGPPLELVEEDSKKMSKSAMTSTQMMYGYSGNKRTKIVFDNGETFVAHIAETPMQKAAGLEVFSSLGTKAGLFFPFGAEDTVTFHMGKVKFPIDILFLLQDDEHNKMRVGKIVANVQPGDPSHWSYNKTFAVLEVAGNACQEYGIEEGMLCAASSRVEAQLDEEPEEEEEGTYSLPIEAGEHDVFDLWKILITYHGGQGDPIYAVQSRESRHGIFESELRAIASLLRDIIRGEFSQEGESDLADIEVATDWLPVIEGLLKDQPNEV